LFFLHTRLFTAHPRYQSFFKGIDKIPLDELINNKRLKAHGLTFMVSVGSLVSNLDDLDTLTELLLKIGQNHGRRKLKREDFQVCK